MCCLCGSYQWSRPAPSITKPNPNVIIRLCDIECNFAAPLTDPSNAPFQKDMDAWAAISNRTYIWCVVASAVARAVESLNLPAFVQELCDRFRRLHPAFPELVQRPGPELAY